MSVNCSIEQDNEEESEEDTPTLQDCPYGSQKKTFPFLRARILAFLVPMLIGPAIVTRDMLLAQYLVDRLGRDENKTQKDGNVCDSLENSTAVPNANELESKTADLMGQYALLQTIPALFACLVFGSFSDYLGRRFLLLLPLFTGLFKVAMTTLIIRFHLSLSFLYLASAVDGMSGSWFTLLIALYSVTADINIGATSRTLSIFLIMCLSAASTAAVSIAVSDVISSLGFYDASLLTSAIAAVAFVVPLFLFPETLRCQQPHIYTTQAEEKFGPDLPDPNFPEDEVHLVRSETSSPRGWVNLVTHLRRLFGFYLFVGTARQRAEMVLLLLIFTFPVANEINLGAIDTLYQMHKPFCWGPRQIGSYNAIRSGGSNILGGVWMALLQKCLPFEVIGMTGCIFQGTALVFEAFVAFSWQFYIIPALLIPAVPISAVVRGIMSMKAKPHEQGALFSSIAVVECACNLVSTTSFNKVYSLTLGSSMPGAIYLLMASCSTVAVFLYIAYFLVRERHS
ncbi:hypothetical protein EGW08_009747 [Elysia chlorotica]|uniref:Major facilitator superfamily (MFS) profile domain-containing protein n=1 Tax=Elysia chlorotica TaxID=188477 RepID=A0A3S1BEY0_ELYCH|nr:hypothetical protein EGW08_009747 [Elysia chlorotica]